MDYPPSTVRIIDNQDQLEETSLSLLSVNPLLLRDYTWPRTIQEGYQECGISV